jgi:type IV pilus assembly protein PilB
MMEPRSLISNKQQLTQSLETDRVYEHRKLGEVLFQTGMITINQLKESLIEQKKNNKNELLGHIIARLGFATDHQVRNALSCCMEIPFVQLNEFDIDVSELKHIPAEFARSHSVFPIMVHKDRLVVAMEFPSDSETLDMLYFMSSHVIEPVLSSAEDIEYAISKHYGSADIEDALKDLPNSGKANNWEEQQAIKLASERPTVRLIHNLITDAITRQASDIHIKPKVHDVDILFRIDGSLIKIRSFDKKILQAAVARIKIIGGMDISERRLPQDGRAQINNKGHTVDLRISIMPTIHGESVVLRILDTSTSLKRIEDIGFSVQDAELFSQLVNKSSGLILVTGPTGSGKTTTLYAALQSIKQRDINIITVEDPVEYHVDDILQIQVNASIGYTFARALRNILRHDPDAIMIGEIRDEETAKIAVESSLTGHLVLSTLHTNNAASTITRLLEIGIQSYLLNSTLLAVLAQRLVKKNCPHCLEEESITPLVRKTLNIAEDEIFYRGAGCDTCHGTGHAGRVAVYELLTVTPEIRDLIQPKVNASDIEKVAIECGMKPLTEHALYIARQQLTSIEEVYRVRLG